MDLEGSGNGFIEIISWHLLGVTEKDHAEPQSG
jgi:hypothetical protein